MRRVLLRSGVLLLAIVSKLGAQEESVVLTGRVVHPSRQPAAGADVRLLHPSLPAARAQTDAQGAFAVNAGPRPRAQRRYHGLVVRTAAGESAVRRVILSYCDARRRDLGVVVVRPSHDVSVRVTDQGRSVTGARVYCFWKDGWRVLAREAAADRGVVVLPRLPKGRYHVVATDGKGRRATAHIALPDAAQRTLELKLEQSEPLRVRVLDASGEEPLADAWVVVLENAAGFAEPYFPPLEVPPTGADGWTVIRGIGGEEEYGVRVLPRDGPPTTPAGTAIAWPRTTLRVPRSHTLRWPLEPPAPPDGTRILLDRSRGLEHDWAPAEGRVEGRILVVPHCPDGYLSGFAIAPDGRVAHLPYAVAGLDEGEEGPRPTAFRQPRSLEVRLRSADGAPAAGVPLRLEPHTPTLHAHVRITDAAGVARWQGLTATGVTVTALDHPANTRGASLGTVDLREGDGRLETRMPRRREFQVEMRLGGRARLPPEFELDIWNERPKDVREDPAAGRVRFSMFPPDGASHLRVHVKAPGFRDVYHDFDVPAEGIVQTRVELQPTGTLALRILPHRDSYYTSVELELHRWDGVQWVWAPELHNFGQRTDRQGTLRLGQIPAGRYRIVHVRSGTASDAVDFTPRAADAGLVLDLRGIRRVRGRVEAPDGTAWTNVRLQVDGVAPAFGIAGRLRHRVGADGAFDVRVPGGRPVTLRGAHALLAPGNEVRVHAREHDNAVLTLVEATTAALRLKPKPDHGEPLWQPADDIRVRLYPREPGATPLSTPELLYERRSGTVAFRVPPDKPVLIWLDHDEFVPRLVGPLVPQRGFNDLGHVRLERGRLLRVEVLPAAGLSIVERSLQVTAVSSGTPSFARQESSLSTPNEVVLQGLPPGHYRVSVEMDVAGDGPVRSMTAEREVRIGDRNARLAISLP